MKLVSFIEGDDVRAGLVSGDRVIDLHQASCGRLPKEMRRLIELGDEGIALMRELSALTGEYALSELSLVAPLPDPVSIRDFYAFEDHVRNARQRRGLAVVPEWYEMPVFYFTNHMSVSGPDAPITVPKGSACLDYELEIACVIGRRGKDIPVEQAEDYIYGYMIMNDWSARDLQREEMKVGLGPAKGKDFATTFGPYLVTRDELESYREGDRLDLEMTATVNGVLLSKGNYKEIHYTFPAMIARASENVMLIPGEVIGSGTVGTGCLLELGEEVHPWLVPGDVVELGITGLGILKNTISVREERDHVLSPDGDDPPQASYDVQKR
ncbi:fumarylacetoacetate hydrolase family protein [Rossellomorea marisflavi]|uniref:Fumarylacetoacetate hydrolase family protein n=1 Tax=Rossellomorea marisflavi TaxID=189381 RepID=A0A5D4RI84_9BACI|nr:fumarylacetoacetate hydrolase family protein [Rossellomorea marisflavi]TYS50590.1 fumarylacetoacetate hydrolase family protein [Rossellomorea marisflavi]UKS65802.1 fumarylacetoacetate hydrolase family protein [Rossellomorea marisflavi]WJV18476.1 fumarylacetoacetate hydrolase family protein [Rossellomorea marisflavi]